MTSSGGSSLGTRLLGEMRRVRRLVTPPLVLAVVGAMVLIGVALLMAAQRGGA